MANQKPRCGAILRMKVGSTIVFHCQLYAGHKGIHEESGDVDSAYHQYLMRWRGDFRDTCENCGSRTEHIVRCLNCELDICLNCRDLKAAEELRNICKECPAVEEP